MIVKFKVPPKEFRPLPEFPGIEVAGVVAVVQAESVEAARVVLDEFCRTVNRPPWSVVADVEILLTDTPQVFAYAG